MKLGDEMGGHIVTGHVDGVAEVIEVRGEGDSKRVAIRLPRDLAPFVAAKGSITLDGVSLTVNEVADERDGTRFTINIIQIGRAHVCTPVTNARSVCRLLLDKKTEACHSTTAKC